MKRRRFFRNIFLGLSAYPVMQNFPFIFPEKLENDLNKLTNQRKLILPPALHAGSKIAITAPASPTSMYEIRHSLRFFKSLGMEVVIGKTIKEQKNKYRYLSAPDEERKNEFMEFASREDINAVVFARGGYGVMRILHLIDFDIIRKNPKIYIGFSDITALLYAIYKTTGLVTYHGPVASSTFNNFTKQHFKKMLVAPDNEFSNKYPGMIIVNEGRAKGKLIGGNLTMISSTLGTDYEIETENSILFLEDVSENAYNIDRMLTQLRLAGILQRANAVIFGDFKNLHTRRPFFPNKGYTIKEVIHHIVKPLGIPTVIGLPFGHTVNKLTFPIGINASLNTNDKSFEVIENTIAM